MTVEELLAERRVEYREGGSHHHVREGWVGVDCPRCSPDSRSFRLGFRGGAAHCWVCGRMPAVSVLAELTGLSPRAVIEALPRTSERIPDRPPTGVYDPPKGVGPLLRVHLDYLATRHVTPEVAEVWGIQGIGLASELAWSVFLPVTYRGQSVSWVCRSTGTAWRYSTAPPHRESLFHRDLLFGGHLLGHGVVAVEGPLDAIRVGAGVGAATFGLNFTHAQVRALARRPTRVVCFDAEPLAQKRARELCSVLSLFPGRTVNVVLESGKDPGEASERELNQLRRLVR